MNAEDKKYEKVLRFIQENRPEMKTPEMLAEKVISQLIQKKTKIRLTDLIVEFLFGWIYIGWVRRSMALAAVCIVLLFGYQQVLILRRINELSGQRIQDGSLFMISSKDEFTDKIRTFRISGKKLPGEKGSVSKEDIDEMIKSVNLLQIKYKDLIDLIEDNPELKKYVETRMTEIRKIKN